MESKKTIGCKLFPRNGTQQLLSALTFLKPWLTTQQPMLLIFVQNPWEHTGSSAGLCSCWLTFHASCTQGDAVSAALCVCTFLWWSSVRRKASRPGLPGSRQILWAAPAVILVHIPELWSQTGFSLSHQQLGGRGGTRGGREKSSVSSIEYKIWIAKHFRFFSAWPTSLDWSWKHWTPSPASGLF